MIVQHKITITDDPVTVDLAVSLRERPVLIVAAKTPDLAQAGWIALDTSHRVRSLPPNLRMSVYVTPAGGAPW
jgi:hypothetical protein